MKNNSKVLDSKFQHKKSFKYLAKSEYVNKKNVKKYGRGEIKISFIFFLIYYQTRYNVRSALIYWSKLSKGRYLMSRKDGFNNATEVDYSVAFISFKILKIFRSRSF